MTSRECLYQLVAHGKWSSFQFNLIEKELLLLETLKKNIKKNLFVEVSLKATDPNIKAWLERDDK